MTTPRPRVLLADDHPSLLTALRRLLAPDCDVVECVSDGAAALAATSQLKPDVVVVDLLMPGLDGLEVCSAIREASPLVKVIILTAIEQPAISEKALAVGAFAVLTKRTVADLLLKTIHEATSSQG
jgi:CheY-like chemotaxis protein